MAQFMGCDWSRTELLERVGRIEQIAGIEAAEAADGAGRGLRMFHVYTGTGLSFQVLVDRGLDIAACHYQGLPLAWLSPSGGVHPAYYEPVATGWLRSFQGGLFVTCGLDQFGVPATNGDESFGLHGRASSLPAQRVSYQTRWVGDEYELEISGQTRQTRLFGENLLLERRITTRLGTNQIRVEDTVTNEGFNRQPHMLLYHCNLGFPLISEETTLHLDVADTIARNPEDSVANWHRFQPPTPAYQEQVFRHSPTAESDGRVVARLKNPQLDFDLQLSYDSSNLPYLFQWKMMGQGAYVLGLEPANSGTIEGRAAAREANELPHLEPGESRSYSLNFEIVSRGH